MGELPINATADVLALRNIGTLLVDLAKSAPRGRAVIEKKIQVAAEELLSKLARSANGAYGFGSVSSLPAADILAI